MTLAETNVLLATRNQSGGSGFPFVEVLVFFYCFGVYAFNNFQGEFYYTILSLEIQAEIQQHVLRIVSSPEPAFNSFLYYSLVTGLADTEPVLRFSDKRNNTGNITDSVLEIHHNYGKLQKEVCI